MSRGDFQLILLAALLLEVTAVQRRHHLVRTKSPFGVDNILKSDRYVNASNLAHRSINTHEVRKQAVALAPGGEFSLHQSHQNDVVGNDNGAKAIAMAADGEFSPHPSLQNDVARHGSHEHRPPGGEFSLHQSHQNGVARHHSDDKAVSMTAGGEVSSFGGIGELQTTPAPKSRDGLTNSSEFKRPLPSQKAIVIQSSGSIDQGVVLDEASAQVGTSLAQEQSEKLAGHAHEGGVSDVSALFPRAELQVTQAPATRDGLHRYQNSIGASNAAAALALVDQLQPTAAPGLATTPAAVATVAPVAAAAPVGATLSTAAPGVTTAPVAAAAPVQTAPAASDDGGGGGGSGFGFFMFILILAAVIGVSGGFLLFKYRAQKNPTGRIGGVNTSEDAQLWKSAKARQSFSRSTHLPKSSAALLSDSDEDEILPKGQAAEARSTSGGASRSVSSYRDRRMNRGSGRGEDHASLGAATVPVAAMSPHASMGHTPSNARSVGHRGSSDVPGGDDSESEPHSSPSRKAAGRGASRGKTSRGKPATRGSGESKTDEAAEV